MSGFLSILPRIHQTIDISIKDPNYKLVKDEIENKFTVWEYQYVVLNIVYLFHVIMPKFKIPDNWAKFIEI